MSSAAGLTAGAARFGNFWLHVLAFAAVWKTAPGNIGLALAVSAALLMLGLNRHRHGRDTVSTLAAILAGWLALRAALQFAGHADPDLVEAPGGLEDWLSPLTFVLLAALPARDRLARADRLWLLTIGGCTAGIAAFLYQQGIHSLWSGERLGFHLNRPLGIGLYAGCFLILVAANWRRWWYAAAYRGPARIAGVMALILFLEVLITAQNRSTWLGLGLVSVLAAAWWAWSLLCGALTAPQRRRTLCAGMLAILAAATLIAANGDIVQQRVDEEQDVIATIESAGLGEAPATSISVRLRLWRYALQRLPDAPWIGHGFGSVERIIDRDLRTKEALPPADVFDHVHNTYLQLLWSQGLVGTVLWGLLFAALLRDVVRAARRDERVRRLVPGLVGVTLFVAVWAFFDYRLSHPDMRFFTILLLLSLRLVGQARDADAACTPTETPR